MFPASLQNRFLPRIDRCTDDALIQMEHIVKTFKNAAGEFIALKDITACFYEGEFVSIVGKSGSGKSTLANMLTGIDHPTSGSVRVGEAYIHNISESKMSLWRGRNLGIVFQFFQLMPTLTVVENVMLPMVLAGLYAPDERERRATDLLGSVGLEGLAHKLPAALSGGQQQCAAIARALANDPPILIADEPTGNLDSRTADEVFGIFAGLIQSGKTILMVTHDAALAQRTSRTLLLSDGELVNPWVAAAFPDLPHPQMLWLTHRLEAKILLPGEIVAGPGEAPAGLWLVTGGHLELVLDGTPGHTPQIVRLLPGESISQSELERAGAALQAGNENPVEVLTLQEEIYRKWLQETPAVEAGFLQRAEARLASLQPQGEGQ